MKGVILGVFLIFSHVWCDAQEFDLFEPLDAEISFLTPCEMHFATKEVFTEIGKLKTSSWSCVTDVDQRQFGYAVTYTDYPEGTFHPDSIDLIQSVLEESIAQNVADIHGELVYKTELPYDHYPGIMYRASFKNNKAIIKARFIIIHDRIYNLQVYASSDNSLHDTIETFLNSFRYKGQ